MAAKKAAILDAARALGIAHIDVSYSGDGDEGQIQDITAWRAAQGQALALAVDITAGAPLVFEGTCHANLHTLIDDFAWDVLAVHHNGFEINDGGEGTISIDVCAGTASLERSDRCIALETTTVEL